jgi:hypothetical protein
VGERGDSPFVAALPVLTLAAVTMPTAQVTQSWPPGSGPNVCVAGLVLVAGRLTVIHRIGTGPC